MGGIHRSLLLLCLSGIGLQTIQHSCLGADVVAAQGPPGYSSPREALEARRKALARRDWGTAFASMTPAAQGSEIEYLVRCVLLKVAGFDDYRLEEPERSGVKARLRATIKKHGVDASGSSVADRYDDEKFIKRTASQVVDKATFYRDASEIVRFKGEEAPELIHNIGELQGGTESGETASGWVVWTRKHGSGSVRLLRKFRRLNGRWFNDSDTWDYTRRSVDASAAQHPPGYSTPREAFEARRKALARRDWHTSFASSTTAVQTREIENLLGTWILGNGMGILNDSELDQAANIVQKAKRSATMKKYRVVMPLFTLNAHMAAKAKARMVADKAAFYEEVSEILRSAGQEAPESIYDIGDLQGIEISGKTATGWVVWNRDHVYENGVKKITRTVRLLRKFRRVDGRWFNDSQTWDYTEFDSKK